MEKRTQIGSIPMQLENDLRVDALNNAAPTRYRRCEPDVRPAVSGHRSRSFLIAGSRALAEIDGGGNQSYYTGDFHGTVQAAFTVSGQLEDSYGYDVFGSPLEANIETDRRRYVGKPFDPLTGLYNYGYRDYRPELGRFTTVDPIRDGMNWYVYTGNDPVNFIDPDGLLTKDADGDVIFIPTGDIIDIKHGGAPGVENPVQPGFVLTDDGTPVDAYSNRSMDDRFDTDCHGETFADGDVWINNSEVETILEGDGYNLTEKPSVGDVAIYRDEVTNEPVHSATVVETTKDGDVIAEGLGSLETATHKDSVNDAWPYNANVEYYSGGED